MSKARPRILIADDREQNRYILSRILRDQGYECQEVSSGADTLEAAKGTPDLIILDVQLPDISGYEVCRRLKSDPATASISILQISASFVASDDRVRALEAGADGYLTHPIDRMVLAATVRALLRLKRAEAESRDAADQWQTTFNSLAEAVAVVDANGCIARWNEAFREMCGSKCQLEFGVDARMVLDRLLGTSDPLSHNGFRVNGEFQIGRRSVQLSVNPVRNNPSSGEKILVLADVTDRKLAEYALLTAEKLAATGKLANAIAHEINNPLEALTNLLYLAQTTGSQDGVQEMVGRAAKEVERISRITRQSLSFHRDTQKPVAIDLSELLRDVIGLVDRFAGRQRVHLRYQCRTVAMTVGFPGQLNQVFSNLIRNAAEAAPAGTEVTVRVSSVTRARGEGTRVTVHDRGAGIPPEVQQNVFDPFFTTKDLKGSGLGLWVSRSLVERHQGTIRFRTSVRPGRTGTTFEVFLPNSPKESRSWPKTAVKGALV
jgi:signal transduction histidine kinase